MNEPHSISRVRHFLCLGLIPLAGLPAGLALGCSGGGDAGGTGSTSTSGATSGDGKTTGGAAGKGTATLAGGTVGKTTSTKKSASGGTQATTDGSTALGGSSQSTPRGGSSSEDTVGGSSNVGGASSGAGGGGGSTPKTGASGGTQAISSTVGKGGTSASAGGTQGAGGSPGTGGTKSSGGVVTVSATKDSEGQIALSGLTVVSYGGYLNGESFQQDGIVSYNGYQYTAFWNTNRQVVMARRELPSGAWSKFDFTDYTNTADDAHNTISLGIAPGDGTLHVSFDHHTTSQGSSNLHYRVSVEGLVTNPKTVEWAAKSFGAVKSELVSNKTVTSITYPRFVTEAGGQKMLFSARIGESGSGDEYLWEYDASAHAWAELGKYIDGTSNNINAYLHSLSYTRGGTRLHASWCWRDTSNASTNHDLLYVYSDDHGRTWKNNAGTQIGASGTTAINRGSSGLNVWAIKTNRGLINQEHMAIDSTGRVHVLLGHMPDNQADDSNFDSARTKSQYFHYWRDNTGKWTRTSIAGLAVIKNFRGKLAIAPSDNVYAVLPGMRIAGASASSNFATWTLLTTDSSRTYFSDPLIDSSRLETENKLTVYYPQASSQDIWGLEYTIQ